MYGRDYYFVYEPYTFLIPLLKRDTHVFCLIQKAHILTSFLRTQVLIKLRSLIRNYWLTFPSIWGVPTHNPLVMRHTTLMIHCYLKWFKC